ncbi:YjgN family protein [Deinococcus aquatilis]|uniref:YjgN family protein n=1 Tax=Deinococcus aquatilis TaxID=519440 RepID=UPI0003AA9AA5|nr:YjgN family protein [Deinococcus aquatilis]
MPDPSFSSMPPERQADALPLTLTKSGPDSQLPALQATPTISAYPMRFTGTAGEFFRLWIVNTALSIVTLGLYLPWARVRTRQYFYGHTWVDGQNFEYTANPVALLRGYLIVAAFFGVYTLATNIQFQGWEWVAGIIAVSFVALYPWLVMKSLRFLAASTTHRGLNFRFHGQAGGAYVAYGVANVAAVISSSLALPWAWFMQRRYQVENAAYGRARATFRGDIGNFYIIGLTALGMVIGAGIVLAVPVITGFALLTSDDPFSGSRDAGFLGAMAGIAVLYLAFLAAYSLAWQYIRGATLKLVLNSTELGGVVRTRATFSPWMLAWIGLSNAAVQVITLGLATPWAAVRRTRYIMEGIQVLAIASLDDFAADVTLNENALGEAATELLDIQLGF